MTTNATHPEQGSTLFIVLISCVATIGGFLFGFDSGVINGTVEGLQTAFNSDSAGTGLSVSSMLLGCAVGAFFAGNLADKYGRRSLLIVASVFFIVSAWGSGVAGGTVEFVIYRILGGLAVGAASVMAPAYISEVAPARYRGMLTSVQQIAIITGLTMAFFSNYLLAKFAGGSTREFWLGFETWRWMFWMELIPAFIFFFALLAIPESPRYLVASGKMEQAGGVLARLYGRRTAETKVDEISTSLAKDHHRPRLSDLINKQTGKLRTIVWIGIGLAVLQQFVGINVVFYYGAVLWQAAGFSENDALAINVISGSISIAACLFTFFFVDKIGRKPLLWFGSAGMAITLGLVAYAFAGAPVNVETGNLNLSDNAGLLALIAANAYVFLFNLSWGPVMWIMLGEMFPNQIRGSGLAVAGLAQWLANFLVTWTFPILLAGIGLSAAYGIYTFFAALSVVFVLMMVHETKGKELEEMEG
ncbi:MULTISPECIES: sugar porter family MFS transporter [unclassified Marinimicrobium]|jgi:SP family sugar:H+ symporter-like MFS transporter|uniref:sugar porter family MFS transporter n=1 Tax=unclassified Marinimicrobium TaxID=2632100 RepID=UPI002579A8E7|nr:MULTISPECIES: sugar porter family MFS transporter [unclassified Marinimicrobium]|tara:strand:+ start:240 stop:1661 length:1422 start_codon:yes stop_codon:yes gene_type:complete